MVSHAQAVNIARRLSSSNEPDLLQESFVGEENNEEIMFSKTHCKHIAESLQHASGLPMECLKHKDIVVKLQRKDSQHDHAVAFEGMPPGEAAAAMAARDKGHLNHAQIQRRLTNSRYKRSW